MSNIKMEDLVNYAKNYGFVYQGSEIYGGLANTWNYGPLGVELKNNIKKAVFSFSEALTLLNAFEISIQ